MAMKEKTKRLQLYVCLGVIGGAIVASNFAPAKVTTDYERGQLIAIGIMKMAACAAGVLLVLDYFAGRKKRAAQDKDE